MLTPDEVERVRRAYIDGLTSDQVVRDGVETWRVNPAHFKAIEKAWRALSVKERNLLALEIAELIDRDDETIEHVVGWALAAAVQSLVEQPAVPRGRPAMVPGLRAVVRELFCIWVERGGPPEVGNPRREKDGRSFHAYPALDFVADGVLQVMPGPYERIQNPAHRRDEVLKNADTQLRALRELGELPI